MAGIIFARCWRGIGTKVPEGRKERLVGYADRVCGMRVRRPAAGKGVDVYAEGVQDGDDEEERDIRPHCKGEDD